MPVVWEVLGRAEVFKDEELVAPGPAAGPFALALFCLFSISHCPGQNLEREEMFFFFNWKKQQWGQSCVCKRGLLPSAPLGLASENAFLQETSPLPQVLPSGLEDSGDILPVELCPS